MKSIVRFSASLLWCSLLLTACGGGGGSVPAPGGKPLPPGGGPAPLSIGSIILSVQGTAVVGVAGVFPLMVTVNDQNGKPITGSYPAPVTLSDSDTSGATTLSTTTLDSSATSVTLNYTGKALASPAIITAASKGLPASAVTNAQFAPKTAVVSIAALTVSLTGFAIAGVAGSYPVNVIVKDQNNNVVTGSYPVPITLSDSDVSGATALSSTTLSNSNTGVTLHYTGKLLFTPATIAATATGVAPSAITDALFAPNAQDPTINGAVFSYVRTDTTKSTGSPLRTVTAIDTVNLRTGVTFGGQNNLIDVHQVHAPNGASAGFASTLDSYLAYVIGASAARLVEAGFVLSEKGNGSSTSSNLTYTPGYIIDELPQNQGNSWNPLSAFTSNATLTDSAASAVTTSSTQGTADGAYTSASSQTNNSGPPLLLTFKTTVRPDGTFVEKDGQAGQVNNAPFNDLTTYTSSLPTNAQGGTVIPLQIDCQTGAATWPGPAPVATSSPQCVDGNGNLHQSTSVHQEVPDWFPEGRAALNPLDQSLVTVNSSGSIPRACNVPSSIATSAIDEHSSDHRLDPDLGMIYGNQTDAYYAQNVGLVCTVSTEDDKSYDQYATGAFQSETQITSVRGLTAFRVPSSVRRIASGHMLATSMAASAVREVHELASQQMRRMRAQHRRSLR